MIGMTGCLPPMRLWHSMFSCSVSKLGESQKPHVRDRDESQFQINCPVCTSLDSTPKSAFWNEHVNSKDQGITKFQTLYKWLMKVLKCDITIYVCHSMPFYNKTLYSLIYFRVSDKDWFIINIWMCGVSFPKTLQITLLVIISFLSLKVLGDNILELPPYLILWEIHNKDIRSFDCLIPLLTRHRFSVE